jgi:NAD(P)-dependent dehydrogenase (short-subunit alcohol dehydrogenase family)
MSSMSNQVVVITGAGRGLGEGMARGLAAKGARVALLDRDPVLLAAVEASLPGSKAWTVDVTDAAGLNAVAKDVVEHFGGVDVVVANAGVGDGGPLLYQDVDVFERVLEVNLMGSTRTVRAFLPAVIERKGYVLQIASLSAMAPAPFMSAYSASKAAVEAFARCLRPELAMHGVKVGIAYLAFTDTAMVRTADEDPALRSLRETMPPPFGSTYPLAPAVARLVQGIERRQANVYAQRWLHVMPGLRTVLPGIIARMPKKDLRQAEAMIRDRARE